uniref:Alpha/beta hydrolases superfamily protein n=1 Tax=Tanacetum cinerariifolium TaxID=118510 RepID=A0A6L2KLN5_TANCI|nr:alpha/beta hydrolases superfamily protein [Tanacetum cinerariifolium]
MKKDSKIYKGKKERVKSIALKAKKEYNDDETSTSGSYDEKYAMALIDEHTAENFSSLPNNQERVKSIALKAKKEYNDDETSTSGSYDEKYAMAVRNFKKLFGMNGRFVRQPPFPKVCETHALSKPVTSNSVPTPTESKVVKNDNVISPKIFRTNPSKTSRVDNVVPNKLVKVSVRTKPIIVLQPHVITKNDVKSKTNGFSPTNVKSTTRTRRPLPRNYHKNDKAPSKSKSSRLSNNLEKIEENYRNLQSSSNKKHMSSECNNIKLDIRNAKSKKQKANVSNVTNQKKYKAQVWKPKNVGSKERLASRKPSTPRSYLRWSPTGRLFDLKLKIIASSESESQSNCSKGDNACTSNPQEPISRRFPNLIFSMTSGQNWFDTLLIPLLSEYKLMDKEDHRENESDTLNWKSYQGGSSKLNLPDHMYSIDTVKRSSQNRRCSDLNHLIGECPKPPRNKDHKAFVGGCWSDSKNKVEDKTSDETCLMAQSSNEETATYIKIKYCKDINYFKDFEIDFLAIIFDDPLGTEHNISFEPTISPFDDNDFDFKISFDESDDKDYTIIYDKILFSYKLISVNDLKTDTKNNNDEVSISSDDVVIEQSDGGVDIDGQSHEYDEDFETNHDIQRKSFNMKDYIITIKLRRDAINFHN